MDKIYYNEINAQTRSLVVWLDDLKNNPDQIIKMHKHHIHLIEMRACTAYTQPFHKDKKINKWITDKIYDVVKVHRIQELDA
tara:strand:- start:6537 stop:6782 length:246 start_codon:yes stop_codon:yes gene_type:complete